MICPNCKFINKNYLYLYKDLDSKSYDLRCTSLQYQKPNLIKCKNCKLIFSELLNIKFEKLYEEVIDYQYLDSISFKKRYFLDTLNKIKKYLKNSSNVLEIGSYYGIFGALIKQHVNQYKGIELSKHGAEYAKNKYNLNIENKTIDEYLKEVKDLDVIIMSHVIEHLDTPFEDIKKIRDKMSLDSVFIFSTYNMDSFIAKLLGKYYHWIMPMHKFYFSKFFLKKFMEENGLRVVETITDTHTTSLHYFLKKISAILPLLNFFIKPLIKIKFLNKIYFKINLGDLDLYVVKKKK